MDDLLKEAIADAKAVRETALENAKIALEEAFTPRLQSMLSKKIQSEIEVDEAEHEDDEEKEEGYHEDDEDPTDDASEAMHDDEEEKEERIRRRSRIRIRRGRRRSRIRRRRKRSRRRRQRRRRIRACEYIFSARMLSFRSSANRPSC